VSVYPLRTGRLVLRLMGSRDIATHAEYRNDPEVAAHQLWDLPYDAERSAYLADQDELDDLRAGEWTTLAIELDGEVIGDVCTHLHETRGVAEIGYTLARRHWGRGYATEAARALVGDLVTRIGVQRVFAELDPGNVASQRVLEAVGLAVESHTRKSYLWRGEWTDNMSYAATAEEWLAWRDRLRTPPGEVRLEPITHDTVMTYFDLATHRSQERFVAPMPKSFAQALFPPVEHGHRLVPRLHGITADGVPAGFCMHLDATPSSPPYLWRFLVDRTHQGRGIGVRALTELVGLLTGEGQRTLRLSYVHGPGSPWPFYERLGFHPTGEVEEGEVVAQLEW
jgi:RimJ/RimL family protein N-acetyltransferase